MKPPQPFLDIRRKTKRIKRIRANVAVRNLRTSHEMTNGIRQQSMTLSRWIPKNTNMHGRGRVYRMMKNSRPRKIDVLLRPTPKKANGILVQCSFLIEKVTN